MNAIAACNMHSSDRLALCVRCLYRHSTAALVFWEGLCLIAISVYGHDPGYGILSIYLVFSLNLSMMPFSLRMGVVVLLVLFYLAAILIWNQVRTIQVTCVLHFELQC